jgi:hypothetical protein
VAVLSMSKQEFSRLDVLLRVQSGGLRVTDACVLIGLQRRQVFRLLRGLRHDGAASLLSKRRGRPSNHRLPDEVRTLALAIVRERYADFGPSLAAEKLAEHHGCSVSRETLRGWMIADGLWQDRRHRLPSPQTVPRGLERIEASRIGRERRGQMRLQMARLQGAVKHRPGGHRMLPSTVGTFENPRSRRQLVSPPPGADEPVGPTQLRQCGDARRLIPIAIHECEKSGHHRPLPPPQDQRQDTRST